jgi:hypothetical protein
MPSFNSLAASLTNYEIYVSLFFKQNSDIWYLRSTKTSTTKMLVLWLLAHQTNLLFAINSECKNKLQKNLGQSKYIDTRKMKWCVTDEHFSLKSSYYPFSEYRNVFFVCQSFKFKFLSIGFSLNLFN